MSPPQTISWRGLVVIVLIALSAAALRMQVVDVGLMSDDYAQHGMLQGRYPGEQSYAPFDLYAFFRGDLDTLTAHVEYGTVPWWTTSDLHGAVMRPLASALLSLDRVLWPAAREGAARAWHLHSLLWFTLMLIAMGLALRRLLPAPMALLALVLVACDACYSTPLGWLANRCSLISTTFAALSLWSHIRWRDISDDWGVDDKVSARAFWGRWALTLVFLVLALAAGEYGLAAPAYIAAYDLLGRPPTGHHLARVRVRQSLTALYPVIFITLGWLVLHRVLGYGTTGSAVYLDPFTAPGTWLAELGERLPRLVAGGLWGLPADTGDMIRRFGRSWVPWTLPDKPDSEVYLAAHRNVALALLAAAAGAWALVRTQLDSTERRRVRALGLGAVLSLLPLTVAPPHSRLLVGAQLGLSVVVAALIIGSLRRLLEWQRSSWKQRLGALIPVPLALLLLHAHANAELRWARTYIAVLANMNHSLDLAFTGADLLHPPELPAGETPRGQDLEGRDVLVVNALSQTVGLHGQFWLDIEGYPVPRSWRSLTMAGLPLVARRADLDTLELSTVSGALLTTGSELFFRRREQALPAPAHFEYPGLGVDVLADDGEGHPTRVQFHFPVSLDDPRYLLLISTTEGLERWTPPAPGQRAIVPRPQLPIALAPAR